jgi:hypothetical protein
MHGEAIGIMQTPLVALSYLIVALILLGCQKAALPVTRTLEQPATANPLVPAAD